MKQKITKNTTIEEALKLKPEAAELLFNIGMMCVGCPMAQQETIEQGCRAHGMEKGEIDELIKKLNEK
jgi:hybrid cluster-associated redox disulfide protein